MVSTPDFASNKKKLKKRSDFYVGPFSCPNQKASFQLEVNHFAAMIMVATSMPKEIINDNTLNVLILITAILELISEGWTPLEPQVQYNVVNNKK